MPHFQVGPDIRSADIHVIELCDRIWPGSGPIHQHAELRAGHRAGQQPLRGRWTHYQGHFAEALAILAPWLERWGY